MKRNKALALLVTLTMFFVYFVPSTSADTIEVAEQVEPAILEEEVILDEPLADKVDNDTIEAELAESVVEVEEDFELGAEDAGTELEVLADEDLLVSAEEEAGAAEETYPAFFKTVADQTLVYEDEEADSAYGAIAKDTVVLVVDKNEALASIVLNTGDGVITGFVDVDTVTIMTGEEVEAYYDYATSEENLVLFEDNLDYPITMVEIVTIEEQEAVELEDEVIIAEPNAGEATDEEIITAEPNASWKDAPRMKSATQTGVGTVVLTWEAAEVAGAYSVYEVNGTTYTWKATVGKVTTATLTDVAAGNHTYAVRPKESTSGSAATGSYSDTITVNVTSTAWKISPKMKSATQTGAGTVVLTWEATEVAGAYSVYEVNGTTYTWKAAVGKTTTATLTGVTVGEHTYAVRPKESTSGSAAMGNYSDTISVTVTAGSWKDAPKMKSATQTGAGTVVLTWEAAVVAGAYSVYEVNGTTYTWKATVGKVTTATLTDVAAGEHTYAVRPKESTSGGAAMGSYSDTISVTVTGASWKDAPKMKSATQTGAGTVVLTWEAAEVAGAYSVYEVNGTTYTWKAVVGKTTTVTLTDVAVGEHTYAVRPKESTSGGAAMGNYSDTISVYVSEYIVVDGVLVQYLGSDTQLNIPADLGIVEIGGTVFKGNTAITSVTIPNTVTTIAASAFEGCSNLASVSIPTSVTTIGSSAFKESGLTSINIPSGVTEVKESTFESCAKLQSATLSQNITVIGKRAFANCSSLSTMN